MKRFYPILFTLLGLISHQTAYAVSEIYAVLGSAGQVLTLYYDENRASRSGVTDWSVYNCLNDKSGVVKKVVIDASMQHAKPETTADWFKYFTSLEEIEGLQYLNTQEEAEVITIRRITPCASKTGTARN